MGTHGSYDGWHSGLGGEGAAVVVVGGGAVVVVVGSGGAVVVGAVVVVVGASVVVDRSVVAGRSGGVVRSEALAWGSPSAEQPAINAMTISATTPVITQAYRRAGGGG